MHEIIVRRIGRQVIGISWLAVLFFLSKLVNQIEIDKMDLVVEGNEKYLDEKEEVCVEENDFYSPSTKYVKLNA